MTPASETALADAELALRCLAIEIPPAVYADVRKKVDPVLALLRDRERVIGELSFQVSQLSDERRYLSRRIPGK